MFFFFQAEDGIRDYKVTGVQTCALPIWLPLRPAVRGRRRPRVGAEPARGARSEERRVGKECGARGAPEEEKEEVGAGEARRPPSGEDATSVRDNRKQSAAQEAAARVQSV